LGNSNRFRFNLLSAGSTIMSEQYAEFRGEKLVTFPLRDEKRRDETSLVDVILRPYGESYVYYVAWEVKPKNREHGIRRLEIVVDPAVGNRMAYRTIVQHVDTSGDVPRVPSGVMLRGESAHRDIPPGTPVRIEIWGDIQTSDTAAEEYSYCRTVISGEDDLTPCE
jgi:hypothetical protein